MSIKFKNVVLFIKNIKGISKYVETVRTIIHVNQHFFNEKRNSIMNDSLTLCLHTMSFSMFITVSYFLKLVIYIYIFLK